MAKLVIDIDADGSVAVSEIRAVRQQAAGIGPDTKRSTRQAKEGAEDLNKTVASLKRQFLGVAAGIASVAAASQGLKQSARLALDFGTGIAEVSTLLNDTSNLREYESAVRDLSQQFGTQQVTQVKALYQAISAGASDVAESQERLAAANKLAIGGVTDTATATNALSIVMNAYGDDVESVTDVSDILFAGMRAGITTIGELASNVGTVASFAAQAKLPFEELIAAVATLTAGGLDTSVAMTSTRAALVALTRQTPQTKEAAKELGIEFNLAALQSKGLGQFLTDVTEAAAGQDEKLVQLFGSTEALAFVQGLAGKGAERLADTMADMEERAGLTDQAYARMSETMRERLNRSTAQARDLMISLGSVILETAVPALEVAVGLTSTLADNIDVLSPVIAAWATVISVKAVGALVALATQKTLNIVLAAQLARGWTAMSAGAIAAATAVGTLRAALALIGGPIGLVAAALYLGAQRAGAMDEATKQIGATSEDTARAFGLMEDAITGAFDVATLRVFEEGLSLINKEIEIAEAQLERVQQRSQTSPSGIAGEARLSAGFAPEDSGDAGARAIAEDNVAALREERDMLLEVRNARAEIAAQFPSQAERYEMGAEAIAAASEAAVGFLEGMGIQLGPVTEGTRELAAANEELLAPLERQVESLREQHIELTQGAEGLLAYREEMELAAAREQDLADETNANVSAVRKLQAERRRLTKEMDDHNKASEETLTWLTRINDQMRDNLGAPQAYAQQMQRLAGTLFEAATGIRLFNEDVAAESGSRSIEDISADFEGLKRSLDPAYDAMETFREESELLKEAFDAGLIDGNEFDVLVAELERVLGLTDTIGDSLVHAGNMGAEGFRALQTMASKGSDAYYALEAAIQASNLAAAIGAIMNQGMGDPYTAFARMAAMAAMVSQFVGAVGSIGGGASDVAQRRQDVQGTGTVLGDSEAKSESIANAMETTADATSELVGINRGMLVALKAMQQGIEGAALQVARGGTDIDLSTLDIGTSDWGFTSTKLADQGIALLGGAITEMTEGAVAQAFATTRKSNLFSTSYRTRFEDLDDAMNDQINLIFDSMISTVTEAGVALGIPLEDLEERIAQFEIQAQEISLKDLDSDEQQAELEAVFSSIFDGLATDVIPFISQFQLAGEGMGDTLVRVATSVQVTEEALARLGFALDETDPERMAQISVGLVEAAGGLETFIGQMDEFISDFAPASHQFDIAKSDITRALDELGYELPATRDGMWELMNSMDITTAAGRAATATLLELTGAASTYYRELEEIQKERESLEASLLQLQGATAELRARELETLDESNRALQERIWALEDAAALDELMSRVGDEMAGMSASPLVQEFRRITMSFRENMAAARELGASEAQLADIRNLHTLQMIQLAGSLEESIGSIVEQLTGTGGPQSFGSQVQSSFEDFGSSLASALDGIRQWLDDFFLNDPSLTTTQQYDRTFDEFFNLVNVAQTGTGEERADAISQLPQLADSLIDLGSQMFGTATEDYATLRDAVVSAMEGVAGTDVPDTSPPTGAQLDGVWGTTQNVEQSAAETASLAAQLLEEIGLLSEVTGELPADIAERYGVSLNEIIEMLLGETQELGEEQIGQLVSLANTLGVSLEELGNLIGLSVGSLEEETSLFSTGLQAIVDSLPEEFRDKLQGPLDALRDATSEADANAALQDIITVSGALPSNLRNQLAPFFDDIDPTDPLLEQVSLLSSIRLSNANMDASLRDIYDALTSPLPSSPVTPPQGFATGGLVTGITQAVLGETGTEMVWPANVTSFMQRVGIPVQSSTNSAAVQKLLEQMVALMSELLAKQERWSEEERQTFERLVEAMRESQERTASDLAILYGDR